MDKILFDKTEETLYKYLNIKRKYIVLGREQDIYKTDYLE